MPHVTDTSRNATGRRLSRRLISVVAVSAIALSATVAAAPGSLADDASDGHSSSWLDYYFNNHGIGSDSDAPTLESSNGFRRANLIAGGLQLGTEVADPSDSSLKYVMAGNVPGQADNVEAQGQTISTAAALGSTSAQAATKIAFIATAHNADSGGQVAAFTLNYQGGSSTTVNVTVSDWCGSASGGNVAVATAKPRYGDSVNCTIYATTSISLTGTLDSITFPNQPRIHVFAIASNADTSAARLTSATPPAVPASITYSVGSAITAAAQPTWPTSGVTSQLEWLVNGVSVSRSGAFAPQASDVGKTISLRAKGSKPGFVPASATSAAVTVQPGILTETTPASITGTPTVGSVLSVTEGTYAPRSAVQSYQWTADGSNITGATRDYLTVDKALAGKSIAVSVTVAQPGYTNLVKTTNTKTIETPTGPVEPSAVSVVKAPVIAGTAQVGATLTASTGTYNPAGTTVAYQWLRNNKPIAGATKNTYQATPTDRGTVLSVRVTATKTGYTTAVTTTKTAQVKSGVIKVTKKPVIAKATKNAKVGKKLKVTKGSYSITGVKVTYQWYAGSKKIAKATKPTYKVTKSNRGKKLKVKVTATKTGYTTVTTTTNTPTVRR